jgi:hypothetical protein
MSGLQELLERGFIQRWPILWADGLLLQVDMCSRLA